MSGPPRVRSTNIPAEPGTNSPKKPGKKPPQVITARPAEADEETPRGRAKGSAVLSQKSMSASCSSDASCSSASSSSYSRASSSSSSWSAGRMAAAVARRTGPAARKKQCGTNADSEASGDGGEIKKKCSWVTPTTDPLYAAFHDEEWGVPVHDDKKLFELLSLSGALAELTWPVILMKRYFFREVFLDFDAVAIAKLNEKKICSAGTPASSLLSEPKLRAIIENARQICKIIEEFGSFDTYIWNFISHKPIVSQFRYSRQVPVKTPKAEVISKDLVRRGFRSVGPTVIYSFMQVAGLTNDHLISCFRFQDCLIGTEIREKEGIDEARATKKPEDAIDVGLSAALGDLSLPQ